jgi:hypothetical protein
LLLSDGRAIQLLPRGLCGEGEGGCRRHLVGERLLPPAGAARYVHEAERGDRF